MRVVVSRGAVTAALAFGVGEVDMVINDPAEANGPAGPSGRY
ncbi:MAG: hypothetical protein AAFY65_13525 [Pseudomonadota bacterium]